MTLALKEAQTAFAKDEVPIGAVIVHGGVVIGRGYNQIEMMNDPTAHAEMIALTAASSHLNSKWLRGFTFYVTLEPCPMCAGAIVLARIPTIVFGCYDPKMGACGTLYSITEDKRLNHRVHTIGGVRDVECGELIKEFFRRKRKRSS